MVKDIWENFIALNCEKDSILETLKPVCEYYEEECNVLDFDRKDIENAIKEDSYPLPKTENREGYSGENHYNYWFKGYRDYRMILDYVKKYNINLKNYFDFGAASGRVVRHFSAQYKEDINIYASDINRLHVDWINDFLDPKIIAFHSHSIPVLPFEDNSLDFITAFSVFSHIETFDTTWMMEFRRVLKPGGLLLVTIHSQNAWDVRNKSGGLTYALKNLPLFKKYKDVDILPRERMIFRWHNHMSYTANVFYKRSYIEKNWGSIFNILEFNEKQHGYQDGVILQKNM